jgi:hypothetical protein
MKVIRQGFKPLSHSESRLKMTGSEFTPNLGTVVNYQLSTVNCLICMF